MIEEARTTAEPTVSPLRILLVEDDEFDVAVFGRAFHRGKIPCEIVRCCRGEEALEGLRDTDLELDLLVTDHQLPGLSGFDLCMKLIDRFSESPSGTPPFALVLLTGVGSEQMAIKALRAGINDYIVKDASREYLDLLPLVLPRVARRHRRRRPHRPLKLVARPGVAGPQAAPATVGSGSGDLGLCACVDGVRERRGRIWMENAAGEIPTLHFCVPLAPSEVAFWAADTGASGQDPAGNAVAEPIPEPLGEHSRHVLIVHPNPIVTHVARRAAELSGCRVAAVANGYKAIEALDREPFDLVLMGLEMPRLDGLETTRRIRRNVDASGGRVTILALGADDDAAERCYQAGMEGAVAPPVSTHGLKAAIERWCQPPA